MYAAIKQSDLKAEFDAMRYEDTPSRLWRAFDFFAEKKAWWNLKNEEWAESGDA